MIFDVLVVGETPAAMSSAALLARKGLKVAWVVSSEEACWRSKAPDLIWDLLPQRLVQNILNRMGVPYKHLEKSESHGSGIQIVTPEFRTASLDGEDEFRRELKRVFDLGNLEIDKILPKHATEESDFLNRYWGGILRDDGVKKTFPLSLLNTGEAINLRPVGVEGIRLEPSLRRFIELVVYAQSYLFQWVFPNALVKHFIGNLARLNIFAQGRLVSPEKIFQEVFQMGGGEVFYAEEGMALEPHHEKGVSLWMGKDDVLNGTLCLVAVSPEEAPALFERIHIPKRWQVKGGLEEAFKIAQIVFSIDAMGIPGGMGENLLLYTGTASEPFEPSQLACLSFEKYEMPGKIVGHYTVFHEGSIGEEGARDWGREQVNRLASLFPFMTTFIDIEDVVEPGRTLSSSQYYYATTRKRRLGGTRSKEGFLGKNFFFIGRRQLDYMGLEGEILTGLKAYHWALNRLSKL